ncbi:ABC transporter ATP-binding protein [uncultured Corynebacterium sp.]|uniref:ABC transporter ATP-binding protein n=1 Tax=uncultured Corynebacterium sp. TaxID=159447 RepID=UPI0025FA2AB5|nr:ABC transporter ATP-binding protein [uncultured Corynebacterium sp.]
MSNNPDAVTHHAANTGRPVSFVVSDVCSRVPPVNNVSFEARSGDTVGIVGRNGSGKTTLLRSIAGLAPHSGHVTIDGEDWDTIPRKIRARRMAFVAQHNVASADLTVRDVIALGRTPYLGVLGMRQSDRDLVMASAQEVGVCDLLDRRFVHLSGGEQQRVHLARALATQPDVILLDEPTNHLDISAQLQLMGYVSNSSLVTVVVLHDLNLAAKFCDYVIVLDGGDPVASGPPRDVFTEDVIERHFDVESRVWETPDGINLEFHSATTSAGDE